MENICNICKTKTIDPKPAKFSPEDPYGKYRRMMKKESEIKSYQTK